MCRCHLYHAEFRSFCNENTNALVQHLMVSRALQTHQLVASTGWVFVTPFYSWGDQGSLKWWDICGSFFLVLRTGWQAMHAKYPLNLSELSVNSTLVNTIPWYISSFTSKQPDELGYNSKCDFQHSSRVSSIVFAHSTSRLKKKKGPQIINNFPIFFPSSAFEGLKKHEWWKQLLNS